MKDFIKDLEFKLLSSDVSFQEFDKACWFFLCSKTKSQLKQLTNELGATSKYMSDTNIGNIRLEIIDKLQINFML